jgi:hypothetical protein
MEKKRRARINVSLEQLRSLLERHYSHQVRQERRGVLSPFPPEMPSKSIFLWLHRYGNESWRRPISWS